MLVQSTLRNSTPWCIHHRGVETPLCIHHRGVETSGVFTTGALRLAGVVLSRESFWTLGSQFTDFKEHTTIFKRSIIQKIVCRLL